MLVFLDELKLTVILSLKKTYMSYFNRIFNMGIG